MKSTFVWRLVLQKLGSKLAGLNRSVAFDVHAALAVDTSFPLFTLSSSCLSKEFNTANLFTDKYLDIQRETTYFIYMYYILYLMGVFQSNTAV